MNFVAKTLLDAGADCPTKLATITGHGATTYAELSAQVLGWACFLEKHQIGSGDLVALNVKDEVRHYQITLALLLIGARHITFASHDSASLHSQLTTILEPKAILSDGGMATDAPCRVILISSASNSALAASSTDRRSIQTFETVEAGSVLLKTSGTTGGINIVELTALDLTFQSSRHPEYGDEGLLRFASIEHNNSKRHRVYAFFNKGLNVFGGLTDDAWHQTLAAGDLKILDISRLHILELLHRFPEGFPQRLKIRTGGSAIPLALRRVVMDQLVPDLFVRYATTEFGGIAMAEPTMHDMPGCVGRPLPGVTVDIVDEAGMPQATGQVGRIRLKGAGAARAYLFSTNPEQAAEKFKGAYFYPGDLGYLDAQGRLFVSGRQDDMIIMNGLNIFPDEVQAELDALSDVRESVCFPVPSVQHGQIPVAAVTLAPGCESSEADLIRSARARLALKAPRRIFIVDSLPVNSAGKHDRAALRDRLGL